MKPEFEPTMRWAGTDSWPPVGRPLNTVRRNKRCLPASGLSVKKAAML